jgi:hypothetical protein
VEEPGFQSYQFKILLSDPEGVWDSIWWADTATLIEAKDTANRESRDRLDLGFGPRESHLTVTDRATQIIVYSTPYQPVEEGL